MSVVVVGGGLAGLFSASELMALGVEDLVVVEASPTPGGVVRTLTRDGFLLEPGAGSFSLPHPYLDPILRRAGVGTRPAEAGGRHVFTEGSLVELRASPRMLLTPLFPLPAGLRAMAEILIPTRSDPDETIAGFCRRRFGRDAGDVLSWLLASGVFAGDPSRLSTQAAFPVLEALERESGSVMVGVLRRRLARSSRGRRARIHVPVGGMAAVAELIAETLGDRFRPGFTVESVYSDGDRWVVTGPEAITTESVVLAVPPHRATGMVDPELAAVLSESSNAPVAVVWIGGTAPSPLPEGFGALVGPGEGMPTRGILFESSYAPERAPDGSWLIKVIVGGATQPDVVDWSDDELTASTVEDAGRIIGADLSPSFVELIRHRPGIPQYEVGHLQWLRRVNSLLGARSGLRVAGWGYHGVGVASLAMGASRLAREIVS